MYDSLASIPGLTLEKGASLARYTRFGIGGPAALFVDTESPDAFTAALKHVRTSGAPFVVIGGGTNLVVSDAGFDGTVLRFRGARVEQREHVMRAQAGAVLQDLVDRSIEAGLQGLQSMTGIPGYVGGAVYGNAGAYGQSVHQVLQAITFTDGDVVRTFDNAQCEFTYRESIFKRNKNWVILSADFLLVPADGAELRTTADGIRKIRDAKYPPTMKCAGSIFKNLFFARLPAPVQAEVPNNLVRDGKVPSAWFLEQVDVKGMRVGDIQVADYHANLIYNDGQGAAGDLVTVIRELKRRVRQRFGFDLEEEVQYVGF